MISWSHIWSHLILQWEIMKNHFTFFTLHQRTFIMFYFHNWGRICRLHTSLRLLRIKTSRFDWTAIQMWQVCNLIPNSSFCFAIVHAPIHRWTGGGGIYFYFPLLTKTQNKCCSVIRIIYKECNVSFNEKIFINDNVLHCSKWGTLASIAVSNWSNALTSPWWHSY